MVTKKEMLGWLHLIINKKIVYIDNPDSHTKEAVNSNKKELEIIIAIIKELEK